MTRYAIVDTTARRVIDIVEVDETIDKATGKPVEAIHGSKKLLPVKSDTAQLGWTWDGSKLSAAKA